MNFRPVIGYEGLYEISEEGVVRGLNRSIKHKNGIIRSIKGRILKQKINMFKYHVVKLSRNGHTTTCLVHRLVAEAFVENPLRHEQVNHIDGNKLNNHYNNLEWVTASANTQHAYDTGLNLNKGATHVFATGVVDNISGMEWSTIKEWCEHYNIPYSTGRNYLNGYNKRLVIDLSEYSFSKMAKEGGGRT